MTDSVSTRPLITIGMTCYNAEDTIRRAVESALAQTWSESEILVVDDGSTDRSGCILKELEQAYPEIHVIRHEATRGFPCAVNTLVAQARGAFIAFFDDDDVSAPDRLEQQCQRLVNYEAMHPGVAVFCYTNRDVVRPGERKVAFQRLGIGRVPPEPAGQIVADYVLGLIKDDGHHSWGMFGSCTLMARTEAFRSFGGFDGRFRRCAELDFAARAAFEGAHFISVNLPLVTQYLVPTRDKAGNADLRYRLLLLKKYRRYLKEKRCYAGAWCYMHAQFYNGRHWRWRLWYLAALVLFPWRLSRERLRRSSLLARLRLVPARAAAP